MKSGFKLALITLPITAIGAGILALIVSNGAPPERIALAERASAVRVISAETHAISPAFVGFGLVTPARTFEAIAEVGGVVEYVNPALRDGQILPAGSVLLRLSSADFNLAVAQANANIRAAEARLAELAVSEANQRAALEIEREVLAVKATDLERAETLFAAGTASLSARDNAHAAHLVQRQKVQSIEGALALFPTQRAVQNEQIAVYRTSLASARLNLARIELTLPFTARVAAHTVEMGQFLKAGQTAAILDGIDQAEVVVQVPLNGLRNLLPSDPTQSAFLSMDPTRMGDSLRGLGLTAQVRLRLGAEIVTWPAAIDRISNGIDPRTGTVGVVVRVDAAYGQEGDGNHPPLTKGMFVDVMLSAPAITGIVLPRSALHDGYVHIADPDNRLRLIAAQPQLVQGGIALFTDGIDAGSRIVLSTPSPVIEGLLLDLHPDNDLMARLLAEDAAQ
jgi:multidrug efflux pump subunit AcrA (membrane-fusion protein)